MERKRYYLEFEKVEHPLEEIAGVYLEEGRDLSVKERTNPYFLGWKDGKSELKLDSEAPYFEEEKEAMQNIFELAKEGYKLIFWFSPRGEYYPEGRIVVGRVKEVLSGDVLLECRGLVSLESPESMMGMAEKIMDKGGMSMDGIENIEDLRKEPVGVNIVGDWCDFGEEIIGDRETWDWIREGGDVELKKEVGTKVVWVLEQARKVGREKDTRYYEMMMVRYFGLRLNSSGNHGGSSLGYFDSLFGINMVDLRKGDERLAYCEGCGKYYMRKKGKCPLCGSESSKGSENRGGYRVYLN